MFSVLDEVADGFAAAAARHVLVGRAADQAGLDQRLAGAARGAVPAAAGPAGNQKVDGIDHRRAVRRRAECGRGQGREREGFEAAGDGVREHDGLR